MHMHCHHMIGKEQLDTTYDITFLLATCDTRYWNQHTYLIANSHTLLNCFNSITLHLLIALHL